MTFIRPAIVAALLGLMPIAAQAAWLRCVATGTGASGNFAYDTTVTNIGKLPPARLDHLKQRLAAYVTKTEPQATGTHVDCFTTDDQVKASEQYERAWMAQVRRLGWDHLTAVTPDVWLADTDYSDGAF
jgi:hypothetical protein